MATRREDLGSWLEGTPGPGPREGVSVRPASGSGSPASVGRRLAAVGVDWVLSLAVSAAFFPGEEAAVVPLLRGDPVGTLVVFALSTAVLVALLGNTIGHRLLRLQVVRMSDLTPGRRAGTRPPGPLAALLRTGLLCLVIPAVIWDASGRGMHDVAAGTVILRR